MMIDVTHSARIRHERRQHRCQGALTSRRSLAQVCTQFRAAVRSIHMPPSEIISRIPRDTLPPPPGATARSYVRSSRFPQPHHGKSQWTFRGCCACIRGEIEIPRATQHDYYEASSHGVDLERRREDKKKTMEKMTSNVIYNMCEQRIAGINLPRRVYISRVGVCSSIEKIQFFKNEPKTI